MTGPRPVLRPVCGSARGLAAHAAAGEPACSGCRRGELLRSLELERHPPPPSGYFPAELALSAGQLHALDELIRVLADLLAGPRRATVRPGRDHLRVVS